MSIERVGLHAEAVWKPVDLTPSPAIPFRLGVSISPPKHPRSLKPRSSATIIRKFGWGDMAAYVVRGTQDTRPLNSSGLRRRLLVARQWDEGEVGNRAG